MDFQWRIRDAYETAKRQGGPMIERLSGESLLACASVTRPPRTVEHLLIDNGYDRPANVAGDDALGG